MNVKILNLMSRVNETRPFALRELNKRKSRLNESICNSKQKRNHDECWCEYQEFDD